MSRIRSGGAIFVAAVAIASCTVDVSLEDKHCPCSEDYVCDEPNDWCVRKLCAAGVEGLEVSWATPHALAFDWATTGSESAFFSYEIVLAETSEDVRLRTSAARVITSAGTPELASLRAGGLRPGMAVVPDLDEDTLFYAQVIMTTDDGCTSESRIVQHRTPPMPTDDPIVLFDSWTPADGDIAEAQGSTLEGTGADAVVRLILALSGCGDGDDNDECGQPVKIGINKLIGTNENGKQVKSSEFGSAFIEIVMRYDAQPPAETVSNAHSSVFFVTPVGSPEGTDLTIDSYVLTQRRELRRIELPLRLFKWRTPEGPGEDLQHADLLDRPWTQFGASSQWHKDSVVDIDAVRIWH